jgi:beta-aspartyl-peptidase (threonine type)
MDDRRGVQNIKNPISLARGVMEQSEHVFMAGIGAQEFAIKINAEFMPDDYFFVQMRYDQLQQAKESDTMILDHTIDKEKKFGTVGCVALDVHGNLAAGTSTGGMTNKKHGRVGDTPIIGAGTYANNKTCAVSCTGHGEFFIRSVVAYDISCLMEYKGLTLKKACDIVVMDKLVKIGGEGGLIALDSKGNIELPYNSEGMYRASKKEGEDLFIGIYKD